MQKFNTDSGAIRAAQNLQNFAHCCGFHTKDIVNENGAIHVSFAKPECFRFQFRAWTLVIEFERVKIGIKMPAHTIRPDHHNGTNTVDSCRAQLIFRMVPGSTFSSFFDFWF